MFMKGSPQVRYEIIAETISHDNNLLNISYLCKIAGVSRSGFYYWQSNKNVRTAAEEQDRRDFDLILAAFKHRGYDKGARGIHILELKNLNLRLFLRLNQIAYDKRFFIAGEIQMA